MCELNRALDQTKREESGRSLEQMTTGAATMASLPRAPDAVDVREADIIIKTPDGEAEAYFVYPAEGKSPAVLVWPDAYGFRPAYRLMGRRLAEAGYAVLTPNPFYRTAKNPVLPLGLDIRIPADLDLVMEYFLTLSPATPVTDAHAFIEWLDLQPPVDITRKMGTSGYCMGGPMTMRTAAERPDRIAAAASFHGHALVTDDTDSPHLVVPRIKANYLFAIAEDDDAAEPHAKNVLRQTFAQNDLQAEIEVYPALHGWCPPGAAVYDEIQAEKAWGRMISLFKTSLV